MKYLLVILTAVFFSSHFAQAGLTIKQKKLKKAAEKVLEAEKKTIQSKCGCMPKLDIKWDEIDKTNKMDIGSCVQDVTTASGKLCKEYKKEFCNSLKTVKIRKTSKEQAVEYMKPSKTLSLTYSDKAGAHCYGSSKVIKTLEDNLE